MAMREGHNATGTGERGPHGVIGSLPPMAVLQSARVGSTAADFRLFMSHRGTESRLLWRPPSLQPHSGSKRSDRSILWHGAGRILASFSGRLTTRVMLLLIGPLTKS